MIAKTGNGPGRTAGGLHGGNASEAGRTGTRERGRRGACRRCAKGRPIGGGDPRVGPWEYATGIALLLPIDTIMHPTACGKAPVRVKTSRSL